MHIEYPTDLTAPGAVDRLIAAHRSVFGDLRMEAEGDEPGGDDGQQAAGEQQGSGDGEHQVPPADKGFPADTPLSEMTAEQQTAYWRDKAQKHEKTWKSVIDKNLTPDQVLAMQSRLAEAEREALSDHERALADARKAGADEARAASHQDTAAAMARMALRARGVKDEDIAAFVTETNLSAFVSDDGQVDDERLLARVDRYAGTAGGQKWPATGQDRRGGTVKESGSDLYDRFYGSKK